LEITPSNFGNYAKQFFKVDEIVIKLIKLFQKYQAIYSWLWRFIAIFEL
jgi:hypothetical protein